MIEWLFAFVAWLTPTSDAEALRLTAPSYLDVESARDHLAAARVAGGAFAVDPDLLLAIAYRESRYQARAIGPVVRGRRACGVMQPIMREECSSPSLLDGYIEGARHLREWMRATRDQHDALIGYAGGYAMIERCRQGPLERVRSNQVVDLCSTPELHRVAWIRRERARVSTAHQVAW